MVFLPLSGLIDARRHRAAVERHQASPSCTKTPARRTRQSATPHRAGAWTAGREATGMTDGATGGTVSHVLADGRLNSAHDGSFCTCQALALSALPLAGRVRRQPRAACRASPP